MNLPSRFYTVAWLALGAAAGVLEGLALLDPDFGDTASEHIWRLFAYHPVIWWVSLGLAGWAIRHLWWRR